MEELFEMIFELIFEGALDVATSESKRIPLPLRIICGVISVALIGGVIFLIVFCGIASLNSDELTNGIIPAVFCFAAAAFLVGGLIWKAVKYFRGRLR